MEVATSNSKRKKIAFIRGSGTPYDETMEGFGGTQLVVLNIAKYLLNNCNCEVYIVHEKRKNEFIGESGINYVKDIDDMSCDIIVDVRSSRSNFVKNVKYLHWIHDCFLCHSHSGKKDPNISKYDNVIALTNIQKSLWAGVRDISNFVVVNNPLILEPVPKKTTYNKCKIVAFSSRTNWEKCISIVEHLRKHLDNRFVLHVCNPSYSDISNRFKNYSFIKNHGVLSHHKTMELLSDAAVCLYPTNGQESFGCVGSECMYYGIPMLTEYVPGSGLNEIIPKQFILKPNCHINDYIGPIAFWYKTKRPVIEYNNRNDEIYKQWEELIN